MKIVLRADVDPLGNKGDVVDVADGYARNYLVPRGLAIKATRGAITQAAAMRRNREAREARAREHARHLAEQLGARTFTVPVRAGEGGRLFGSVTAADLAEAVRAGSGIELDRRRIALAEPIKALGPVEVDVSLHADVTATLHIEVVPA